MKKAIQAILKVTIYNYIQTNNNRDLRGVMIPWVKGYRGAHMVRSEQVLWAASQPTFRIYSHLRKVSLHGQSFESKDL